VSVTDLAKIPVNNEIVTEILPVHTLNPAQLVKDLELLIPGGDTVTANEAGNAVVMTASQKDIHRLAAIITALDRTAVSEVNVFALNYADAKSVAAELKELFQSADADASRAGARITFGPRFGRVNTDGGGEQKEKTTPTRPVFVADEQMNAVAVSAPPDDMPMIARVIALLDRPGQDVTDIEVFPCSTPTQERSSMKLPRFLHLRRDREMRSNRPARWPCNLEGQGRRSPPLAPTQRAAGSNVKPPSRRWRTGAPNRSSSPPPAMRWRKSGK